MGAPAEGLVVGGRAAAGKADDRLQVHGHQAVTDEILELAGIFRELVGEGGGAEGCGLRAVFALQVRGFAPADPEFEVAQVKDVPIANGQLGHGLVVHVGAVAAMEVANAQLAVGVMNLRVDLRDAVGRKDELEARLTADPEGKRLDQHAPELPPALGDALQDPRACLGTRGRGGRWLRPGGVGHTQERTRGLAVALLGTAVGAAETHPRADLGKSRAGDRAGRLRNAAESVH